MDVKFGHIPGTKVGQIFKDRRALKDAGIHANIQKGIWGVGTGACSIVLSGGYEDDEDYLDFILYTGQGGQDEKTKKQKNKKMIGSLPKIIALLMVLLLVGSTCVGGIIYFIR